MFRSFRQSEQLFACFGGCSKGSLVTKQRLSRRIIDTIKLAYSSLSYQCPMRVRAYSTRGIALSWAWSSGVFIAEICAAAGWASPSTYARFYNLEVPALQVQVLSAEQANFVTWQPVWAFAFFCTLLALNQAPRLYRLIWDDYSRLGRPRWVWNFDLLQCFPVIYLVLLGPSWCLRQVQVLIVPLALTRQDYTGSPGTKCSIDRERTRFPEIQN